MSPQTETQWYLIRVEGVDAADYLDRLTTIEASRLAVDAPAQEAFLLSAQGRVEAVFWINRAGPEQFELKCDDGVEGAWAEHLFITLEKYHFVEKLEISKLKAELAPRPTLAEPDRILAMQPRVDFEITHKTIPLEIGMTHAIERSKGCYPGQEVIERIFTYGAPARRLCLLKGNLPAPKKGEPLMIADKNVGEVTSVSEYKAGGFVALAMVKKLHAKADTKVEFGSGSEVNIVQVAPYEPDTHA